MCFDQICIQGTHAMDPYVVVEELMRWIIKKRSNWSLSELVIETGIKFKCFLEQNNDFEELSNV